MKLVLFAVLVALVGARAGDPDEYRTGPELITSKGLPCEQHWVQTPDYFVLGMIRIPRPGAPPVFLQHGLLDSADTWLVNNRTSSLAYIMYDAGFDVWLGNSRGNKYSRNNTKHNPNPPFDGDFWDFTWDDMAEYDVPTQVDYLLKTTGKPSTVYVGHSQGTTQAFANFATSDWDVKSKISLFVGLAPVARVYNTQSVFIKAISLFGLDKIVQFLGIHEFLPTSKLLRWLLPTVCEATPILCDSVIYLFAGLDLGDLDQARMPVYTAHFPSGTSVKDMVHWGQGVRYNRFARYDYGFIENLVKYGQTSPPLYEPNDIYAPPMALFYGGNDDLADPTDVNWLISTLPADTVVFKKFIEEYAHLDFVWGEHAATEIYDELVTLARQYSNVTIV